MLEAEAGTTSKAAGVAIRYHAHYRKGHLPTVGGVGEQPWLLLSAIETVERAAGDYERDQMEEAKNHRQR